MEPNIPTYLFTQGVLGVCTLILGIVCIKLYNKIERQEARIQELHELRFQDSKEVAKNLAEVLEGNAQANRILAEKIEAGRGI